MHLFLYYKFREFVNLFSTMHLLFSIREIIYSIKILKALYNGKVKTFVLGGK